MKKSNFRDVVLSVVAGAVLALVIVLSSAGLTQNVSADDYCVPPDGCGTLGCFTRGDGAKSCKNYNLDGGSCASNSCKTYNPKGGEGGEVPIDEGVS